MSVFMCWWCSCPKFKMWRDTVHSMPEKLSHMSRSPSLKHKICILDLFLIKKTVSVQIRYGLELPIVYHNPSPYVVSSSDSLQAQHWTDVLMFFSVCRGFGAGSAKGEVLITNEKMVKSSFWLGGQKRCFGLIRTRPWVVWSGLGPNDNLCSSPPP